jgi:predicted AAA+ superfamily ATPase
MIWPENLALSRNLRFNLTFDNMVIARKLAGMVHRALRQFPALVITGPRRAGKTKLLRKSVPKAQYVLLEDPDIQDRFLSDPRSFLESLRLPVILDEIQNAPRLLDYARTLIDTHPRRMGQ